MHAFDIFWIREIIGNSKSVQKVHKSQLLCMALCSFEWQPASVCKKHNKRSCPYQKRMVDSRLLIRCARSSMFYNNKWYEWMPDQNVKMSQMECYIGQSPWFGIPFDHQQVTNERMFLFFCSLTGLCCLFIYLSHVMYTHLNASLNSPDTFRSNKLRLDSLNDEITTCVTTINK